MKKNPFKNLIIWLLIIFQLSIWFYPLVASAQFSLGCGNTPLFPCFTNDFNAGNTFSISGPTSNTAIQTALTAAFADYQLVCLTPVQVFEQAHNVATLGLNAAAIISGDASLVGVLQVAVQTYNVFILCAQAHLATINAVITPNVFTVNIKQQMSSQISAAIQAYKVKLQNMQARLNTAQQSFWKTLLVSILLQTSKSVADALVAKLVNNFKIANIKKYVDSVATLMYDNQFLRDNYPGAQGQLMARAVLENPLFRYQIQPAVFMAADASLGFNPSTLSPGDPSFYAKMASVGAAPANPYYQNSVLVGNVDQAHLNALNYAQNNVAQSNGYKAPVTCAATINQQKNIDAMNKAALDQITNRQNLLNSLLNAAEAGQNVKQSDINKASADLKTAQAAYQNIPYAVSGNNAVGNSAGSGGNNTEGTIALTMCEAVSSPAILVNQGIDSMFKALGGSLTQYNSNNLPAYINLISGIVSQIGSSMVLGGLGAAKGAALVNENQAVTATAGLGAQYSNLVNTSNPTSGIIISNTPNSGLGNSYTLSWQIVPQTPQLATASYVVITGNGAPGGHQPLTNNIPVTITPTPDVLNPGSYLTSYPYIITVFDSTGKVLGSSSTTVTLAPSGQQAFNNNANSPAVAGAFTGQPVLNIRGPAMNLMPRGQ